MSRSKILALRARDAVSRDVVSKLAETYEVVMVDSLVRGLALLRHGGFAGIYANTADLAPLDRAGVLLQADLILETISDGVAVLGTELSIIWANEQFRQWAPADVKEVVGHLFYEALGVPEILGPDYSPCHTAMESGKTASSNLRCKDGRYLRVSATPIFDEKGQISHLINLVRDVSADVAQQQKIRALYEAASHLANLDPEEIAEMSVEERILVIKENILRYTQKVLHFDYFEIRALDQATGELNSLLSLGMPEEVTGRKLLARAEGNGVTGFVAATRKSYLCDDTEHDPLYLPGAENAKSSMTVALVWQQRVIGTFNVESTRGGAFTQDDLEFLEIFGRNVALALNTFELLLAEKASTTWQSIEKIDRRVAVPVNDILADAAILLDQYPGQDSHVVSRLEHILSSARAVKQSIQQVADRTRPVGHPATSAPEHDPLLAGKRILLADADESVRRSALSLLSSHGCQVETARNGTEAVAMAKANRYDLVMADIRMPDKTGYEIFSEIRARYPDCPIALMTAFGYDSTHSVVKARKEGLKTVLFKPFRLESLRQALRQELGPKPS